MIWIAAMALAAVLVKLGMLIVMVKLLSAGLGLMVGAGVVLAVTLFWKKGQHVFDASPSAAMTNH